MKRTFKRARWGILIIASLLFASMLACQAGAGEAPTVQITFPPTGRQVAVGDVVPIHSTSQDDRGVTSVELLVAGQLVETTGAPGNERTFAAVQQWTPSQAGVFNVGVRAYDSDGQVSEPALVTIEVVATAAEVTEPLPAEPSAPTQAPQPTTGPSGQPTQGPSEQPTQTPLPVDVASPPAFATVGGGPDLECANWRYEGFPDPVVVGQPVALEVIVWNSGNLQAFNFRWGVQPASPAMEYMESQETITLNGGQDGSYFWQGAPIVYDQAGQYTMLIMVDLHDAVEEVNENNNQCQGQITVVEAQAPTPTSQGWQGSVLYADAARSGHLSIGMGGTHVVDSGAVVGDDAGNGQLKGFLTFDLSGIPDGATIVAATLNLESYAAQGAPFQDLGALSAYHVNYGDLDGNDWDLPAEAGRPGYYSTRDELGQGVNVLTSVQRAFGNGWDYQLRLEFAQAANADGREDTLEFNTGGGAVKLVISYTGG
jgi:hypothetical protein